MLIILAASIVATPPCLMPTDAFQPMVMPADGADSVPTNVTPIVSAQFAVEPPILFVDGAAIVTRIETLDMRLDELNTLSWLRVIPEDELAPGAVVEVLFGAAQAASFTVGAEPDVDAPAEPVLEVVGPFADGACPPLVEISVDVDGDAATVARLAEAPSLADGAAIGGIGAAGSVVVIGDADAQERVFVSAIDLAGNVSSPARVEVTFPPEFSSCGNASLIRGPAPTEVTLALAILLLVRLRGAPQRR